MRRLQSSVSVERPMRRIDELHLNYPFAGSRMLRDLLRAEGVAIGRQRVATMMRRMPTFTMSSGEPDA